MIAPAQPASDMAANASQLYAKNVENLLELLVRRGGRAEARLRGRDRRRRLHHPRGRDQERAAQGSAAARQGSTRSLMDLITEITIFVLAAFVGFEVISKVPTTLHTPLMSQTNAIHGIVMLGGLIVDRLRRRLARKSSASIAIAFGTINIVGGFMVTDRMLGMFVAQAEAEGRGRAGRELSATKTDPARRARRRPATSSPRSTSSRSRCSSSASAQGTHPTTAKRGNLIAAAGMAVAVVDHAAPRRDRQLGPDRRSASLVGDAVGVVASRRVQMTAMPQMVALYNGVGGGAVALIAWSEFRHGLDARRRHPARRRSSRSSSRWSIGSVSFWGSNIAFGKLQDLIPARPVEVPGPAGHQRAPAGRDRRRLRRPRRSTTTRPLAGALRRRPDRRGGARQPRSCCRSAAPTCRW